MHKNIDTSNDTGADQPRNLALEFDPENHVSPEIAHELNNILAIVQGYADRLLLKYPGDPALATQLKMITEAARRAAAIIRDATPAALGQAIRVVPQPEPSVV